MGLEQEVEGESLTPLWYAQALISKSQAESLQENVEQLVVVNNRALHDWAKQLAGEGRVWQSAAVLSRHLEYLRKLETRCLALFKTHYESLQSAKYLSDLKWPNISPEGWLQETQKSRDSLNQNVAKHIVLLGKAKRPDGVPDYLGQFVHATGESLLVYILTQRANEAKLLALGYVIGTLVLFDEHKPPTGEVDVFFEQRMQVAAAPVLDMMELFGYAKLIAELHGKDEMWTAIQDVWEKIIGSQPDRLKWLSAVVLSGEPRTHLPHRGLMRTTWGLRVRSELAKVPRRRIVSGGTGIFVRETVKHSSPLVRYAAEQVFLSGKDIFAAVYLAKLPGAEGLKWGHGVKEIDRSLERERRRHEQNGDQEEPEH